MNGAPSFVLSFVWVHSIEDRFLPSSHFSLERNSAWETATLDKRCYEMV